MSPSTINMIVTIVFIILGLTFTRSILLMLGGKNIFKKAHKGENTVYYPLINLFDAMSLKNLIGLILMYGGFGLSLSIFLYHGFIKSVPRSVEEAAVIDGASIPQMFFTIVFPLLKTTTVTVVILNAMWIWNDYLLPYLVIGDNTNKTLTLELYFAKMVSGAYGNPYQLIFPAVLVSIIPIIIVFLFLQKYFVKGVSDGAVKS